MRVLIAAGLLAAAAGAGGCYASAGYSTGYSAGYVAPAPAYTTTTTVSVDTYQPDLVDVGGGVQVIADYDEPIFYSDSFYWWFFGGSWYRSGAYTGGWVRTAVPPAAIVRLESPHRYRRYRPHHYVVQHRPLPAQRVVRPTHRNPVSYRDHRAHRR